MCSNVLSGFGNGAHPLMDANQSSSFEAIGNYGELKVEINHLSIRTADRAVIGVIGYLTR